jgi:hypothetical protein
VVDRDVMGNSAKRLRRGTPLGEEEQAEARQLLDRLGATVRAAAAVFMTDDARAARQPVAEKEALRDLETVATRAHFAGLRGGPVDPASLDLDPMRKLRFAYRHWPAAARFIQCWRANTSLGMLNAPRLASLLAQSFEHEENGSGAMSCVYATLLLGGNTTGYCEFPDRDTQDVVEKGIPTNRSGTVGWRA